MKPHPTVVCGVDGGGTSTRVLVATLEGEVLGEGRSGSGNLHDVGEAVLARHVEEAWRAAWAEAGTAPRSAARAFCSMASVGTPSNRETVECLVARIGLAPRERVRVEIDLVAALAGGLGGEPGIALIAGTGSSCFGRDSSGRTLQVGGGGSLLDDVGGATWMGTQAMVAAVRAHDGRGCATSLEARVMEHFGLSEMRGLLPRIDADGATRARRAELARLVTEEADRGDEAARAILEAGAEGLAECAAVVERELDFEAGAPAVVVTGGLAAGAPGYLAACHRALERRITGARCVVAVTSNGRGAVLEALADELGRPIPAAIRESVVRAG